MTDVTLSRAGQVNAAGSQDALFLKKFGGQILTAFDENNIMEPLHIVRQIDSGVSARFPATWKASAAYHVPGNRLTGSAIKQNERVINIDDLLVSHTFVYELDQKKNHWDIMSEYSHQLGEALAVTYDQQLLQVLVLAARASATVTGGDGGTVLTNASFGTSGSALGAGLFAMAQAFDEKRIPKSDRYAAFRPAQYYNLAQATDLINKDWGGMGAIATGEIVKVANFTLKETNNLPVSDLSGESTTGHSNTYVGDFSTTVGSAFHRSAVGTVKLMDMAFEKAYLIELQSDLMVAKMAVGHGILRPEAAGEFKTA
jgi:hypothetical protein